jgi:hypothetical protein
MFAYREPGRDKTARVALMFAAGYAAFGAAKVKTPGAPQDRNEFKL